MKKLSLATVSLVCLLASPLASANDFCKQTNQELAHLYNNLWKNSGYASYNESEFDRYSEAFDKRLQKALAQKKSLSCNYSVLNKSGVQTYRSSDGRLQVFSWDAGTGGTLHDFARAVQYVDNKGKLHYTTDDASYVLGLTTLSIPVKTGQSPVYALTNYAQADTTLRGQGIELLQIDGDKLTQPKLITTTEGQVSEVGIAYNHFSLLEWGDGSQDLVTVDGKNNEFSIAIVVEDTDGEYMYNKVTQQKDVYRFDGKTFELVK